MNLRPCVVAGALCLLSACARTYLAAAPKLARSPSLNVAVDALRVRPIAVGIEVRMRLAAHPGTRLRGAKFALARDAQCSTGLAFDEIEADGSSVLEGPLDIGGWHELVLTFGARPDGMEAFREQWRAGAQQAAFVDLELIGDDANTSCVRVPLLGTADAPSWRMDPTSAGFSIAVGGRAYPVGIAEKSEFQPNGGFYERLGVAFGDGRIWTELGAASTGVDASRHVVLAAGGDGAFLDHGPWSLRAGLGYDLVLNLFRPDPNKPGTHRATLYGPRATLGVSYALIRNLVMSNFATHPELEAGHRTLSLELDLPVSVWVGSAGAPKTMVVPGVGFGVFWSM